MAKKFLRERTSEGTELTANTLACVRRHLKKTEKRHGRLNRKTLKASLLLAAMYCAVEDFQKAEPLLQMCIATAKNKLPQNADALFWASNLLAEAYFAMNHREEGMTVNSQAKPFSKAIDPSASDLVFGSLWHLALSFEAEGKPESRQKGLVVALVALCWFVTRGLARSRADAHVQEDLRLHFSLYGIVLDEWHWVVKHAHLTKYDFIGLLSIVLANADTAPASGASWIEREPKVHVVR